MFTFVPGRQSILYVQNLDEQSYRCARYKARTLLDGRKERKVSHMYATSTSQEATSVRLAVPFYRTLTAKDNRLAFGQRDVDHVYLHT